MVDRKVVVVVVAAVGVILIGGIAGAVLFGGGGGGDGGDDTAASGSDGGDDADSGDGNGGGTAATPTKAPATVGNGTDANGTATPEETPVPTATSAPTPTGTPTVAPTPTDVPTRTPMLTRRFSEEKIEIELRRMIDDWREDQGIEPYKNHNGSLVADINEMATNHSVAMAEAGKTVHESNNLSVPQRYRAFDLYERCKFKEEGRQNIVTPDRYQFEVLHKTYAGKNFESGGETVYHDNETQIARDIFEAWTENAVYAGVLDYPNANRLGIGIEITESNEVYVTGNICGAGNK